jgi:LuxR family transcriptional regulator
MSDPNVSWGFGHTGVIRWSELDAQDPVGVIAAARRHGMTYGFAWATFREGSRSVAGLSRPDREYSDEEMATIGEVLIELHDATANGQNLTAADRQALKDMSIRLTHN